MLSDRHRWAKLTVLATALVALCVWYAWHAQHTAVGYTRCMADPAAHDGQVLELSLWRVESVEPHGYHLRGVERGVPVIGPSAELEVGAVVSVVGRFDADRSVLVEDWREVHHARRAKAILGALGLLATLAFAAARLRWRQGRLVLRA
jgi:hypothetical protein